MSTLQTYGRGVGYLYSCSSVTPVASHSVLRFPEIVPITMIILNIGGTLQGTIPYPTWGKGKSSTQKYLLKGMFSFPGGSNNYSPCWTVAGDPKLCLGDTCVLGASLFVGEERAGETAKRGFLWGWLGCWGQESCCEVRMLKHVTCDVADYYQVLYN